MSLRTELLLSYLAIIILVTAGYLTAAQFILDRVEANNIAFATQGVKEIEAANVGLAREILTALGERAVEDKADTVAKDVAFFLGGKKSYDYHRIRQNERLRRVATQDIQTLEGVAGYVDLLDNRGEALLHPNREVEGQNFSRWREEFPEMWRLVSQAFTNPLVKGYYTFLDRSNQPRQKFMVLKQVPHTPFIVAAVVNIDQYFQPTQGKIIKASQEVTQRAQQVIKAFSDRLEARVRWVGLAVALLLGLLTTAFACYFASSISRSLRHLRDGVQALGGGNFAIAVPAQGAREVKDLAHAFNHLGSQLTDYIAKRDFIRDTFGRYVTQEVVKRLLESEEALEMGGETREVSLLMSDLRGFTAITSEMTPEEVILLLNRYLGKMIEILTDHRAIIDEIMGDGILAFFGAPEPMEDHPSRAVACALTMQAAMEEVNEANAREGLPHLEMGIAVSTGTVVVGNIGSEKRTKYSVVGSPVNFTSRMESFATGGQVLISTATLNRVKNQVELGEIIEVQMKGVPGPSTLYEVVGMKGPVEIHLKPRQETPLLLEAPLPVRVYRIRDKVVVGELSGAVILELCDTAALVRFSGELSQWEDVRLRFSDQSGEEAPGRIYGKVMAVHLREDSAPEAHIRFTSVPPEMAALIRTHLGGQPEGIG
jgi:class 3 adenylate cyclase